MKRILSFFTVIALLSTFSGKAFDLKSVLQTAGDVAGNLLGKTDVTIADLEGTWNYSKPAVAFKSDNLLKKAGGSAAASVIEEKMAPYYEKAGITSMKLTIQNDSTFTMKMNKATLKGKLEKDTDGNFVFNFQALGKVNIGHITSVITKSGSNIDVTFDASKLVTLVSKIATLSGNSTIKTVSTLLNSYDGMNAGFQLTKAVQ